VFNIRAYSRIIIAPIVNPVIGIHINNEKKIIVARMLRKSELAITITIKV
jgi:hypothetical protein